MNHKQVFKRLFQYVTRYKWRLFSVILLSLFAVAFEVAKPLPIKMVIDNVLANHPLPQFFSDILGLNAGALHDKKQLLYICIGMMAVISIGSFLLTLLVFNLTIKVAQGLVFDLMVDFFQKLQRLSLTFYSRNKVGDLLQRMSGDVFVVYFLVAQIVLPAITSLLCLGVMFYILAQIDLVLAIVAFSVVPLLAVLLAAFAKPMNDTTTVQYRTQGLFSAFIQQSLSSIKIIQAFGRESFMHQKLKQHATQVSQAYILANKVSMTYNQMSVLITGIASAVLVLLGAFRGLNGGLSIGELYIFLGYVAALYGPVNSLTTAVGAAIMVGARGKRVIDILDSDEVVKEKPNAISPPGIKGAVEFKNVSFGYENEEGHKTEVLKDISFKVEPGQVAAIVGPTGTGKTSLISLIARFYDPWSGKVLLDDNDISDLKLQSLREHISLVLQEPFMFPMTIAENIAFGNPEATLDEIKEAAKGAQAHDFISQLPEGYNTMVTEGGTSLSGGEKQRIAIARAFLKKASVLILDEPTSAVDASTEAKIFQALTKFAKGKTVFVITHRLSTIKHSDLIVTIQNGMVVEMGTHQSLLEEGKIYADLFKYHHIN